MEIQEKNNKFNDSSRYFSCYSTRIYQHLTMNGFEEISSFQNIKTGKFCRVYLKNPELCECIAEVSNRQK